MFSDVSVRSFPIFDSQFVPVSSQQFTSCWSDYLDCIHLWPVPPMFLVSHWLQYLNSLFPLLVYYFLIWLTLWTSVFGFACVFNLLLYYSNLLIGSYLNQSCHISDINKKPWGKAPVEESMNRWINVALLIVTYLNTHESSCLARVNWLCFPPPAHNNSHYLRNLCTYFIDLPNSDFAGVRSLWLQELKSIWIKYHKTKV